MDLELNLLSGLLALQLGLPLRHASLSDLRASCTAIEQGPVEQDGHRREVATTSELVFFTL